MDEIIASYTRAQATQDGVLIDVSNMAKEAGFVIPVAVTAAVWNEYIVPSDKLRGGYGQSEDGRLWDLLHMLYVRIKRGESSASRLRFEVSYMLETKLRGPAQRIIEFQSVCHAGDAMEPVITIMLPTED
ncbi:MAG: DUF6573 family protein [Bacilli bacterium]